MNLAKRGLESSLYLWNLLRSDPADQVRVVIFGQGRTGSTLLESLLCSTGHFSENGELLNRNNYGGVAFPAKFIQGLAKWKRDRNFIFHLKIYHLTVDRKKPTEPEGFLDALTVQGWKVIYLRRENEIKHTLSNMIAVQRGEYFKYDDEKEDVQITIEDCDKFAEGLKGRRRHLKQELSALEGLDYCEVIYERDLEGPGTHQATVDRVLDYLSLERREAKTPLRKVNTWPMDVLITNYQEFADSMRKHGLQHFLD